MNIISKKSASKTKYLSYFCNDPVVAYSRMMSDLKETEMYIKSIVARNMFTKMIKLGVGTEEVVKLAGRIVGKMISRNKTEIRRIMGMRLREINKT